MTTSFPAALDVLSNPSSGDRLNSPSHAAQHANANDAIEALESVVGITNSTNVQSHEYRISEVKTEVGDLEALVLASL
jgi:hypothetical protein